MSSSTASLNRRSSAGTSITRETMVWSPASSFMRCATTFIADPKQDA